MMNPTHNFSLPNFNLDCSFLQSSLDPSPNTTVPFSINTMNNEAAKKCRERIKSRAKEIEDTNVVLTEENRKLKLQLAQLQSKLNLYTGSNN
eukprot:Awhi_evm1s13344